MDVKNPRTTGQLLKKYSDLEYLLLGDLRDLLEEPFDQQTCNWLKVVLDGLLDTLPREFELEEEDGYMDEVLEQHPNWKNQVEQLHQQHQTLFASLKQLRDRIDDSAAFAQAADLVKQELRDWITTLLAHNRHENRLLQTAMNLEIGIGD